MKTPQLRVVAETGSTNSDLLAQPWPNAPEQGHAESLWAMEQTAGRGRRGKTWAAQQQGSICLSVKQDLLDSEHEASKHLPGISLAVGVALLEVLDRWLLAREIPCTLALKWPNDLIILNPVDGSMQKLGGVLIEAKQQAPWLRLVAGFGLNLYPPTQGVGNGLPAAGLVRGETISAEQRSALAELLACAMHECINTCLAGGWAVYRERFEGYDALLQRSIQWQGQHACQGIAQGVDDSGALRVRVDNEGQSRIEIIHAGEVSVRALG